MTREEHLQAAERWLQRAEEIESGPKCHLAKTYATIALAHLEFAKFAPSAEPELVAEQVVRHLSGRSVR